MEKVVGAKHVLSDPELKSSYERDYTGRYGGTARLVVRPADTEQVAGVMTACSRAGAAIVPQGGNTGLVGASVPRNGEVLVSLQRLASIGEVDEAIGQVTVGAGATLAALQDAAKAAGQDAALDFGARDSCTVGGVVACDAGGARALRHGTARAHVAGLEAVLADGSVLSRLAGLTKDNAGYDLPGLLVGSEGTLGIITRVRWKLAPLLSSRVAALVPLQTAREAADLLKTLRANAPSLESCDFFLDEGLELVLEHQQRESPIKDRSPFYVLAECAAQSDPTEELAAALQDAGVDDALIADDTASRRGLWTLREGHTDAINAAGVPHKLDVGVPLRELDRFIDAVPGVGRASRRRAGDPVRAPRRRQRPRQRARRRPRRRARRRGRARAGDRVRRDDQRRAWRRRRQGRLPRTRPRPGRGRRDARDQARARPAESAEPGSGVDGYARAVNSHGIRLTPWMNALRSSSGSPASMSGITRSISLNTDRSCVRASEAPRQ